MGHHHDHSSRNEKALWIAFALTAGFLVVEVVGGIWTGSLALLSDAGHMLTDVAALLIAIGALRISRRPADKKRSFGYYRFEVLGAALNASVLLLIAVFICVEAYRRLMSPELIRSGWMLAIAVMGVLINVSGILVLKRGSGENLNMRGAYLEVWSDFFGSVAVIVAAAIVWLTGWLWVDPLLAALLGLWVVPRTWLLLSESVNVLLEGVPADIDIHKVEAALRAMPGVSDIHDLHIWAIGSAQVSLTAHLVMVTAGQGEPIIKIVKEILVRDFGISHSTLQVESVRCTDRECLYHSH